VRRYTVRQSFTVPSELKAKMKVSAQREGISLSEWVRRRVDEMIALDESGAARAEQDW